MKRTDLLSPFQMLYGAVVAARRRLYEKGIYKSYNLGAPTISVGNITVGGTGKTPLVAFAARVLAENGAKVCILTRGYKRADETKRVLVSDGHKILADAKQSGDEPFELARQLLGVSAVVADANRAAAGKWARENLGATAFVLDDAFQHLKVRRDLDVVCVDATNPFGNKKLLPAGILREPLRNLKRASAIVITRANLIDVKQVVDLKTEISNYNPHAKIFVSENKVANTIDLNDFTAQTTPNRELRIANCELGAAKHKSLAFCALGNPESFFEQLRREEFNLVATKTFRDHYTYAQKDVEALEKTAAENGARLLLTTAKDAVKLANLKFNLPCLVVESGLVFDDEENLKKLIVNAGLESVS